LRQREEPRWNDFLAASQKWLYTGEAVPVAVVPVSERSKGQQKDPWEQEAHEPFGKPELHTPASAGAGAGLPPPPWHAGTRQPPPPPMHPHPPGSAAGVRPMVSHTSTAAVRSAGDLDEMDEGLLLAMMGSSGQASRGAMDGGHQPQPGASGDLPPLPPPLPGESRSQSGEDLTT
jgi:hypothetical protein